MTALGLAWGIGAAVVTCSALGASEDGWLDRVALGGIGALGAVGAGLAGSGRSADLAVAAVVLVGAGLLVRPSKAPQAVLLLPAGAVATLVGVGVAGTGRIALAVHSDAARALILAGAAAVVISARAGRPRAVVALVPALVLASAAMPHGFRAAAAASGVTVAVAAFGPPSAALAAAGMAVTALPANAPGAFLFFAAAALAGGLDAAPGAALVLGLPAAAETVTVLVRVGDTSASATLVVCGIAAGALALLLRTRRPGPVMEWRVGAVPAVIAAAWLVVAPGTWTWAGPTHLRAYDFGAAVAVAAGLAAVVARWAVDRSPVAS